MLTQNQVKHIKSLHQKKFRDQNNEFIIEGEKIVSEFLNSSFTIKTIITTAEKTNLFAQNQPDIEIQTATNKDLERITTLTTPPQTIAIVQTPPTTNTMPDQNQLNLFLDNIQNPGNLGTIIRTCDWFGIKNIFCSLNTVDAYNPKVIQATMGSITRVKIHYTDLNQILEKNTQTGKLNVYGTFMDGKNIYTEKLSKTGIIIMGNEGQGISTQLQPHIKHKITIPSYPANNNNPESLNVAVATAIICAEFCRQNS